MPDIDQAEAANKLSVTLDTIAKGLAYSTRTPVLRWPGEAGPDWEDVSFPSADGIPLEGWFMPCAGSNKLIISAHAFGFTRAGFPRI